jgi:arylsulfatase A-like enzyme
MTTPKKTHEAFFLVSLACEKLKEIAKNGNRHPFHMRIDFWGPHEPYLAPQEYVDRYNPKEIPKHPNFIDDLNSKPKIYKKQNGDLISENNVLVLPNPLPWSEWQKVLAINYAEQTLIDEATGLLIDTLKELDLAKNTVIIWSADHGDALACHGGHFDKDAYMPQEVIRIPLAVRGPDIIPKGLKCDKFVSNLDFSPTILDIAGTNFTRSIDGNSFLSLCKNEEITWKKDQFCETHGHFTPLVGRALINENYKYIFNEGYMNELYDLRMDPFEMNNLINRSDYDNIRKRMEMRLIEWRKKTGDNITSNMIRGRRLKR